MSQWYFEEQEPGLKLGLEYDKHLLDEKSEFQKIDVYETKAYGKLLTLDGLVMTTDRDEFYYHEMISHPALFTHPNAENVLIIGGGDGGALREVLKHPSVKKGHLCEIDKGVCDAARLHFPQMAKSFENPKSELFMQDGFKFLDAHKDFYQAILVDSTDPIGEAAKLFEDNFVKKVYDALTDDGITVMQCENPFYQLPVMKQMYDIVKKYFKHVNFYFMPVPTYPSGYWCFLMGSKKYHPVNDFNGKLWESLNIETTYYNDEIHRAAFALPQYVKRELLS